MLPLEKTFTMKKLSQFVYSLTETLFFKRSQMNYVIDYIIYSRKKIESDAIRFHDERAAPIDKLLDYEYFYHQNRTQNFLNQF